MDLLKLPGDAQLTILRCLEAQDLLRTAETCRTLHSMAKQPQLWSRLCLLFSDAVNIEEWRTAIPCPQSLFRVLYQLQPLVGVWAARELPPRGGLVCVVWEKASLGAYRIRPDWLEGSLRCARLFTVRASADGSTSLGLVEEQGPGQPAPPELPGRLVWASSQRSQFHLERLLTVPWPAAVAVRREGALQGAVAAGSQSGEEEGGVRSGFRGLPRLVRPAWLARAAGLLPRLAAGNRDEGEGRGEEGEGEGEEGRRTPISSDDEGSDGAGEGERNGSTGSGGHEDDAQEESEELAAASSHGPSAGDTVPTLAAAQQPQVAASEPQAEALASHAASLRLRALHCLAPLASPEAAVGGQEERMANAGASAAARKRHAGDSGEEGCRGSIRHRASGSSMGGGTPPQNQAGRATTRSEPQSDACDETLSCASAVPPFVPRPPVMSAFEVQKGDSVGPGGSHPVSTWRMGGSDGSRRASVATGSGAAAAGAAEVQERRLRVPGSTYSRLPVPIGASNGAPAAMGAARASGEGRRSTTQDNGSTAAGLQGAAAPAQAGGGGAAADLEGLWTGTYGPHGVEILHTQVVAGELLATKITGDPNVPCGEVSFKASLDTCQTDDSADFQRVALLASSLLALEEHTHPIPFVKMFDGFGRIADHNFQRPQWVAGKLFVDVHRNIAFLWQDLPFVVRFKPLDIESIVNDV